MRAASTQNGRHGKAWTPRSGYTLIFVPPALFLGCFFLWPLMRVVARSFLEPTPGLQTYVRVFGNALYWNVFNNTIVTASVVTIICLIIAYPVAFVMASGRLGGRLLMLVILIALWTSAVIRAYAWLILFQRNGILNDAMMRIGWIEAPVKLLQTPMAVQTAMVHILLPLMVLPLYSAMRGIDKTLLRAAMILGASPMRAFVRVYLPLSMAGVQAGSLLVFVTALGFFIVPSLLGGTSSTMVAVLIEQLTSEILDWPMASALATLLLIITVGIYLVYVRVTSEKTR